VDAGYGATTANYSNFIGQVWVCATGASSFQHLWICKAGAHYW
jgi:hypothetical protein